MSTISLGMIVRNEGRTLQRCLESVTPYVDQIVIGLAGESTDNTAEILKRFSDNPANHPVDIFHIEWDDDFSAARNAVLERCTGDYYLWLDGDDELIGGEHLGYYIETQPQVDAFYMGYDYARDEHGKNTCYLVRERLVKRHREHLIDWKWQGKIHEVLIPQFPIIAGKAERVLVRHHKPPDKHAPDRNLKILYEQLGASEPNPDPRILAYLGSENAGRGNLHEAILHWNRFIQLSGWDEEKYQVQVKLADAWRTLGQLDKAIISAQKAINTRPDWPDAYFSLAKTHMSEPWRNWHTAIDFIRLGAQKGKPETFLIVNPLDYNYEPSLMLATCYLHLGDWEMALENYKMAYMVIQDPVVAQQIQMLSTEVERVVVKKAFLQLREHLGRHDEWLKVRKLFDVVPKYIEADADIREVWARSMQQTAHVVEPQIMVDFYTGNPHWTPMADDQILDPSWLKYPRLAFALSVARSVNAKTILDWGCSDGFISLPLAKEGYSIRGFDLDPRCIDLAQVRAKKWGIEADFEVANVDNIGEWGQEKADLGLFFEVIEHLVDPVKTLDALETTAHHLAFTTPYMAWENGNLDHWDAIEPKGHLRIFDLPELEALLTPRGRIWNLYREPWGTSGWIFGHYEPGAKTDKNVVIYTGYTIEEWSPKTLQATGLGGSETAVIKLGEALAERGHRPIVYSRTPDPGYFNGVCYRELENFNAAVGSDLFIAWRAPELADLSINTNRLVLWMHDTDAGDRLTEERAERFDSIVVLTEWHKQFMLERYPFLNSDKLVVIGNGVDLSRFEDDVVKNPKKVVYASSPDRGLDVILESIWPKVVEQIPDAELHVYYGWNNIDAFSAQHPYLAAFRQKVNELFLNSKNVVQHGRIPQEQLAREFQSAAVWLYPTYFSETYCITAVEAQLAGAIPITNHLAGLAETVRSGIIIDGDVRSGEVRSAFVEATVRVLKSTAKERKELYQKVRENAPAMSWRQIASLWDHNFLEAANARD